MRAVAYVYVRARLARPRAPLTRVDLIRLPDYESRPDNELLESFRPSAIIQNKHSRDGYDFSNWHVIVIDYPDTK